MHNYSRTSVCSKIHLDMCIPCTIDGIGSISSLYYCNLLFVLQIPPTTKFDFVKPGGHLGALGCVVSDAEKSTSS